MWKSNFSLHLSIDLNCRHTSKKIKGGSSKKILEKKNVFPKKYVELRTFDGSYFMGVNSVGLKSAQPWGCPCFLKCLFKDIRSAFSPSLPLLRTCVYIKNQFWKLADRYNCVLTNRRDLPPCPLFIVVGVDSWISSWLWDKVSNSQLRQRVPYIIFSLNTASICICCHCWQIDRWCKQHITNIISLSYLTLIILWKSICKYVVNWDGTQNCLRKMSRNLLFIHLSPFITLSVKSTSSYVLWSGGCKCSLYGP
jgi:hypothetical protein